MLTFLSSCVPVKTKKKSNQISSEWKEPFRWNKQAFLEGESPILI